MHSHMDKQQVINSLLQVLILVVMEDALAHMPNKVWFYTYGDKS